MTVNSESWYLCLKEPSLFFHILCIICPSVSSYAWDHCMRSQYLSAILFKSFLHSVQFSFILISLRCWMVSENRDILLLTCFFQHINKLMSHNFRRISPSIAMHCIFELSWKLAVGLFCWLTALQKHFSISGWLFWTLLSLQYCQSWVSTLMPPRKIPPHTYRF